MADMALIQGAISGLKTATDIAKSFLELKSIADVQGKVIELQSAILSAQSSALAAQGEQSSMVQRIRDLEEEITSVTAWDAQKPRYQLTAPWNDNASVVYALKESHKESEPAHWICAKCYDDGRRTILQQKDGANRYVLVFCPTCKSEIHTGCRGIASPSYV